MRAMEGIWPLKTPNGNAIATDSRNPPPTRIRLGTRWFKTKSLDRRPTKLPSARAGAGRKTGSTAPVRVSAYQKPKMAARGVTAKNRYRAEPLNKGRKQPLGGLSRRRLF